MGECARSALGGLKLRISNCLPRRVNAKIVLAVAGFWGLSTAASAGTLTTGPTGNYYLSNGSTIWNVKGLALVNSWTSAGLPMAVDTTIRTTGNFVDQSGAQYSLGGTASGTTYANPGSGTFAIWDGTTDTSHNYTVTTACDTCGGSQSAVIRTDLDWSNPVVLFTAGTGGGYDSLGITYDATNNSLWVSNWNAGSRITDYAMNGSVLSSFDAGFIDIGGLALDSTDGTLWATQNGSSALSQYSKSGTLLQSGTIAGLTANTLWAGEFGQDAPPPPSGAPEPASLVLFGAGAAALALLRRRTVRS